MSLSLSKSIDKIFFPTKNLKGNNNSYLKHYGGKVGENKTFNTRDYLTQEDVGCRMLNDTRKSNNFAKKGENACEAVGIVMLDLIFRCTHILGQLRQ